MCECGCVGMGPKYKLPGPIGTTYTIQVYPGCRDCGTPIGLVVSHFAAEVANDHAIEDVAPMKLEEVFSGHSEAAITILHPPNLRHELASFLLGAAVVGDKIEAEVTAEDAVDHCLRAVLFKDPPRLGDAPDGN